MFSAAARLVRRLLDIHSARGVSFALTAVTLASKPLGYLRLLVTAWAFGTSPAMDAFHLANGIVTLFISCVGGTVQNAFLPELERLRAEGSHQDCRSFVAVAVWGVIFIVSLMCAAFAIAPGVIVRSFASGFDAERIRIGAVMIWWLAPFAAVSMIRPVADIWAMFNERYTLPTIASFSFNIAAIPALMIAAPIIGAYSVAFSISVGHVLAFAILLIGLGGLPFTTSSRGVPWRRVGGTLRNALFYIALSGLGALYMVIDRWFASMLPSGAVASISYGGTLITLLSAAAASPMLFFLSKVSREVNSDDDSARETVRYAMAIMTAYFVPLSLMLAACARPVVSLIYGWGSFGDDSTDMTSTALFAYSFGLPFTFVSSIVGAYGVASRRLRAIFCLSVLGALLNTALNWVLVRRFGLFGLAMATSASQFGMMCLQIKVYLKRPLLYYATSSRFFHQIAVAGAACAVGYSAGVLGSAAQLAISAALLVVIYAAYEVFDLTPSVPEHWRVGHMSKFLAESALSYVRRDKK